MTASTTTEPRVDNEALQAFAAQMRGPVLGPDDAAYEDARKIWNGLIDRRPALIAQCSGAADVVDAVDFAREHGLLLSILGGGHNVAGNAVNDGGLVIDLSRMRGIHVDRESGTVRVQGGATLGDMDRETQLAPRRLPSTRSSRKAPSTTGSPARSRSSPTMRSMTSSTSRLDGRRR